MRVEFSNLVATKPPRLSKAFRLENDTLTSHAVAQMVEGVVYKRTVDSIEALASFLAEMKGHNWAIVAGITAYSEAQVVTKKVLARGTSKVPTVARCKQQFYFPDGPGLLCLDYDPQGEGAPLTASEFYGTLVACCPWLAGVGAVITASASSHIYEQATGKQFKGPGGLHAYLLIDQAGEIPNAINAIFQSSFAQHGYALITKSGAILPRTLVDRSSPQPERLLFECGAVMTEDLEQRRPLPHVVPGHYLASQSIPSRTSYEIWRTLDPIWLGMKRNAAPGAERVREAWIGERLASGKISRETLERAVCGGTLGDDFLIALPSQGAVSIRTIRTNMPRYEGMQIPDPLEPDYRDGSLCAVIFSWGIFSQAHGGYQLQFSKGWVDAQEPIDFDLNLPEKDIDFD